MVQLAEAVEAGLRPHGQLDRRGRPLRGHLARGHVRRGRRTSTTTRTSAPSTSPSASFARSARGPGASTGPGIVVGNSADRRDGQGRRPLLLLQADPPDPQRGAAVDADARRRGAGDQHRPGRLRRRGDGPHRSRRRASTASVFSLTDPNPLSAGEVDRHLRPRRSRARVERRASRPARSTSLTPLVQAPGDGACRSADAGRRSRPRRLRHPALGPHLRQLPDPLRLAPDPGGAGGHRHHACRRSRPTPGSSGTTGSATSTPTCSATDADGRGPRQARPGRRHRADDRAADPRRADARRPPPAGQRLAGEVGARPRRHGHRRLVGNRQVGRAEDRRRRRHRPARRPDAGEARGDEGADRGRRRHRPHPPVRPLRLGGHRPDGCRGAGAARPRRRPRQQRRPLDPPLDRALLRPPARLRADDAAQLLRGAAPDPASCCR